MKNLNFTSTSPSILNIFPTYMSSKESSVNYLGKENQPETPLFCCLLSAGAQTGEGCTQSPGRDAASWMPAGRGSEGRGLLGTCLLPQDHVMQHVIFNTTGAILGQNSVTHTFDFHDSTQNKDLPAFSSQYFPVQRFEIHSLNDIEVLKRGQRPVDIRALEFLQVCSLGYQFFFNSAILT